MTAFDPVQTFVQEADDLLTQIEEIALDLRGRAEGGEAVNHLFRAFHTIKGSGAMFGFEAIAEFTHHVETTLDQVRTGSLHLTPELLGCVLAAKDHIKVLLETSRGGAAPDPAAGPAIIAALEALAPSSRTTNSESPAPMCAPVVTASSPASVATWKIRFRPNPALMVCGTNPASLLNELRALGECTVTARLDAVPALETLQPDECHVAWDVTLRSACDINAIKDVFIFVEDGSELTVTRAAAIDGGSAPTNDNRLEAPASATADPEESLAAGARPAARRTKAVDTPARRSASADSTVRVPAERLDRLVNLVGELVMNESRLSQVAARLDVADLNAPVEEIERLIDELRETVLGLRMMPIGSTFSRFNRLVHDLSGELGKEIDLVTAGAETELDKTVLDRLGDPLIHLIRNSIDHGIEPAGTRVQQGKPRRGTLRLSARHTGSNVVISIEDDGRGLDQAAIRAKAAEKGLISPDANLSERETFNLIFLPGFSTAKQVTSVSGRGVGMDVVKRQLDALRGTVAISSTVGQGTCISLTLPLTLAIVDGLLVSIDQDKFVIPTSAVMENVELTRTERAGFNGRQVVAVRGELIPYLRLRELFELPDTGPALEKVVIVQHAGERVGLVVDRVLGSHQTVIQPLGRFYRNIEVLSGATIMGDGRVALILDIGGLVRFVEARTTATAAAN
jgi:two-component system, chemotaxis family, sensor kinase CheA